MINVRRKGHAFERWCAIRLRALFPNARRGIGQARSGGEVADLEGTPYWVECKHQTRPNIYKAFEQACAYLRKNKDTRKPVVISRATNGPVLVTMELADWEKLHVRGHSSVNGIGSIGQESNGIHAHAMEESSGGLLPSGETFGGSDRGDVG